MKMNERHKLVYRFRLHLEELPGRPDMVLEKYETAFFIHGRFWHQHMGCTKSRRPTTRTDYVNAKLDENARRNRRMESELVALEWSVLFGWECEPIATVTDRIVRTLITR